MSSTVRCRFRVDEIRRHSTFDGGEAQSITLLPSFDPAFHVATPHGKIELTFLHSYIGRLFQLGHEYDFDISLPGTPLVTPPAPSPRTVP